MSNFFADQSGIRTIETVDTFPRDNLYLGRVVYDTTTFKLYRYTSSGWQPSNVCQEVELEQEELPEPLEAVDDNVSNLGLF